MMTVFSRMKPVVAVANAVAALAMLAAASEAAVAANRSDPVARAEAALEAWRMDEVAAMLPGLPHGAAGDYVRGVAANRSNDIEGSMRALLRALPVLERQHSPRTVQALLVLADDYRKRSSYADQASTLRRAVERHADQMKPGMLSDVRTDLALASALAAAPPQTVSLSGESRVPIRRNPVGTFDVDVVADGIDAPWMLDSGANSPTCPTPTG